MRTLKQFLIGFGIASVLLWAAIMLIPPQPVAGQGTFAPFQCNASVAVSSASSVQVVTAANSNSFVYVCAMSLGSIAGSDFSIVEGTGTTCATNTAALAGGTTAATGYGLAANGSPIQDGGGVGYILKTKTAGDNVCLIVSGTGPLAGFLTTAQQPY